MSNRNTSPLLIELQASRVCQEGGEGQRGRGVREKREEEREEERERGKGEEGGGKGGGEGGGRGRRNRIYCYSM